MLLERDHELTTLGAMIHDVTAGRGGLCVLEGPAGIGKTRLLAAMRSRASEQGALVLSASASELERGHAFGVVTQLFEPAVHRDHGLLGGAAAPARAILGPHREESGQDPSFASLHGLYWLTVRLSEQQPLVLAIDDMHACDLPSLRFLAYLRARLGGLPVLAVGSVRSSEPSVETVLMDAILGHPDTAVVRPRALSEAATCALIEQRLGTRPEAKFAAECHRATGGNPLLLEELTKAFSLEGASPDSAHLALLRDVGPRSVARTVFLRLRQLGTDATAVAQALAVLGDGADLAVTAALAGLDLDQAGHAMTALARAEILRYELPLGFVHPLVADAIYSDLLPGQREPLHVRAAELLAAGNRPVEQVAAHLLHAPARGAKWVVDQLERAAAEATRKGSPDSAVAYLERALAEPPTPQRRADLTLALGRAQTPKSGPAAIAHLRAAYALLTDPEQRAITAQLLGRVLLFTGDGDEAVRIVREAAAALPAQLGETQRQLEALEHFCGLFIGGERAALHRLERYRTPPVEAGIGAKMLAAIAAQAWMHACGPSEAVSKLSSAALLGGELIEADSGWAATFAISNLTFADQEEAERWWEYVSSDVHRRGSLLSMAAISMWRGVALRRRGELADAEQSLQTCYAAVHEWGYREPLAQVYCDAHLAAVLRERGDLPGAHRALAHSSDSGRSDEGTRQWLGSRLELHLAEGSFEQVIATADDYARRFDHVVRNPMDVPWRSLKALALDRLGQRDRAAELVLAELELARAWGAPSTVSRSLRALGTIERGDGLEHLEEAVTVVAGSPACLEHAKALAAFGAALRRSGRPAQARAPLREALDIATRCGAETLASQARSELYASGGRPRRTALAGVDALTTSERRVAALAAEGRTNREVGEALFITPKTVAMHLSNAYRKLGVTSRRSLPDDLASRATHTP
ncbi:AAA family ATPase [Actinopolymorpha pittospori]